MQKLYRVYRYALFLLDRFKYLLLLALVVFVISTTILWLFHPEQHDPATRRGLGEVSFGVFELMFASEPALPYPKGSLPSQIVYFALPVLNILGLAAAVAQFSQICSTAGCTTARRRTTPTGTSSSAAWADSAARSSSSSTSGTT